MLTHFLPLWYTTYKKANTFLDIMVTTYKNANIFLDLRDNRLQECQLIS